MPLPEEVSLVGRDDVDGALELRFAFRVVPQVVVILIEIREVELLHPFPQPPLHHEAAIVVDINPAKSIDEVAQQAKRLDAEPGTAVEKARHAMPFSPRPRAPVRWPAERADPARGAGGL
jgi:hypothetical protein